MDVFFNWIEQRWIFFWLNLNSLLPDFRKIIWIFHSFPFWIFFAKQQNERFSTLSSKQANWCIVFTSLAIDCTSFCVNVLWDSLKRTELTQHASSTVNNNEKKIQNKNTIEPELCWKAFQWFPLTKGAWNNFFPSFLLVVLNKTKFIMKIKISEKSPYHAQRGKIVYFYEYVLEFILLFIGGTMTTVATVNINQMSSFGIKYTISCIAYRMS